MDVCDAYVFDRILAVWVDGVGSSCDMAEISWLIHSLQVALEVLPVAVVVAVVLPVVAVVPLVVAAVLPVAAVVVVSPVPVVVPRWLL